MFCIVCFLICFQWKPNTPVPGTKIWDRTTVKKHDLVYLLLFLCPWKKWWDFLFKYWRTYRTVTYNSYTSIHILRTLLLHLPLIAAVCRFLCVWWIRPIQPFVMLIHVSHNTLPRQWQSNMPTDQFHTNSFKIKKSWPKRIYIYLYILYII